MEQVDLLLPGVGMRGCLRRRVRQNVSGKTFFYLQNLPNRAGRKPPIRYLQITVRRIQVSGMNTRPSRLG